MIHRVLNTALGMFSLLDVSGSCCILMVWAYRETAYDAKAVIIQDLKEISKFLIRLQKT